MRGLPGLALAAIVLGTTTFAVSAYAPFDQTYEAKPLTATYIPTEHLTVSSPAALAVSVMDNTVSEAELNARITGLLAHVRWLIGRDQLSTGTEDSAKVGI